MIATDQPFATAPSSHISASFQSSTVRFGQVVEAAASTPLCGVYVPPLDPGRMSAMLTQET